MTRPSVSCSTTRCSRSSLSRRPSWVRACRRSALRNELALTHPRVARVAAFATATMTTPSSTPHQPQRTASTRSQPMRKGTTTAASPYRRRSVPLCPDPVTTRMKPRRLEAQQMPPQSSRKATAVCRATAVNRPDWYREGTP